jgi:hypothetical protein
VTRAAAETQWDCQQLLLKFFHLLDAQRYGELVPLFDEDGVWSRPGAVMRGHSQIAAALQQRPAHRLTRHLVSNFLVLQDRLDRVEAVSHLTTYAFERATVESAPTPPEVQGPTGIFTAKASFRLTSDGVIRISTLDLAPELSFRKLPD